MVEPGVDKDPLQLTDKYVGQFVKNEPIGIDWDVDLKTAHRTGDITFLAICI